MACLRLDKRLVVHGFNCVEIPEMMGCFTGALSETATTNSRSTYDERRIGHQE